MSSPLPSPASARFPPYVRLNSTTTLVGSDGSDAGDSSDTDGDDLVKPRASSRRVDSSSSDSLLRSWTARTVASRRRLVPYFLLLLSLALSLLAFRSVPSHYIPSSLRLSHGPPTPISLPPTLVGPRPSLTSPDGTYSPSLYGDSCTAEEFLVAVKGATLRPDGASRDFSFEPVTEVQNPQNFTYSFDFPEGSKCAPPRAYSQDEACELLGSFGGLYMVGDSYARHIYTALLIILRNRLDGGVADYLTTEDCRGEHMYLENKTCRERVPVDTLALPAGTPELCGGKVHMSVLQRWEYAGGGPNDTLAFAEWKNKLPSAMQTRSPLLLESWGIHFNYHVPQAIPWISQVARFIRSSSYPRPLNLLAGVHHPPYNQIPEHAAVQGVKAVAPFKEQVDLLMREYSAPLEMWEGGGRYVDFFEATNGAKSYDGCHLPMQANLEKAQILLNLVDILYADVVRHGGLVEAQV
ncbi:hypothetical protein JCM6882_004552 [Rhodosporidiobolus microsporus]